MSSLFSRGVTPDRGVLLQALVLMAVLAMSGEPVPAAPPPGYYDSVDTTNPSTLRTTLHQVIDDHTRFPYTSSSTDTWNILESAQEDPANSGNIIDVYHNRSLAKIGGGVGPYNREHSWPKSYGFPDDAASNYPYTDCYQLFLCDSGYNSSRSNKPFRYCNPGCSEKTTDANNGQGGGSGVYPGNSNWTSGSFTQGTWEVWIGRRGDIARAQFYLDVRYEGGTHGITGAAEPDLILTDNESLIDASNTGQNESVAYMGMLSVLLQWHLEDPVDDWERNRNDVVFSFQGNRNPFIDHPEWVDCIFNSSCGGGSGAPAQPGGLSAVPGDAVVNLDWNDNSEPDLDGYNVYRSTTSGGPYGQLNPALLAASSFSDTSVTNGTAYYYVVTAVNTSAQESANSSEVSATPQGGGGGQPGPPWINEFHYDNSGSDTGEFVEIAGATGTDLTNWTVYGYNGNGGGTYKQVALSGVIPDQGGCMGTLGFAFSSMQNGAPDALALVDPSNTVVRFISYEGVLVATNGPAAGTTSADIGVSQQPAPPIGQSLQLSGTGSRYEDFSWLPPSSDTEGSPNTGQVFDGCGGDTTPPGGPTGLIATGGSAQVALDWADNTEPDLAGYNIHRSTNTSGPYTQVNGTPVLSSNYADMTTANCTTYYYVVTAEDDSGNESGNSDEVSAIPSPSGGGAGDCDANGVPDDCQADSDTDGLIDVCDGCPNDANKTDPGICGCGVPDTADGDFNDSGQVDGQDVQLFVGALTSGSPTQSDICHGDFDGVNGLDMGDMPGMVEALLEP